jgi:hypothetical protein
MSFFLHSVRTPSLLGLPLLLSLLDHATEPLSGLGVFINRLAPTRCKDSRRRSIAVFKVDSHMITIGSNLG